METVNTWIAMAVSVMAVLGGVAGMLGWLAHTLDAQIPQQLGPTNAPIEAQEQSLQARIDHLDRRMDDFDVKLDHVSKVLDLRLRPLEQDMALIKRHLLGSPAA